jgi:hypothetical protein
MMARLLAMGVLLSAAYTLASYALCSLLEFISFGLPASDLSLAEDLGMFALFLALWLISQPVLCTQAPKGAKSCKKVGRSSPVALSPVATWADASQAVSCGSPRLRRAQRRRHLRQASEQLRDVVGSLSGAAVQCCGGSGGRGCSTSRASGDSLSPRGLHNFHATPRRAVFLLPVEVAACHYPPDISEHLQRLLEDRWTLLESAVSDGGTLTPIPE